MRTYSIVGQEFAVNLEPTLKCLLSKGFDGHRILIMLSQDTSQVLLESYCTEPYRYQITPLIVIPTQYIVKGLADLNQQD